LLHDPNRFQINPFHTVPTLQDEDFTIWDSHAINAYLVDKHADDDSLYPKDLQKRAVVDQRLHFDSHVLSARLGAILVSKTLQLLPWPGSQEKINQVSIQIDSCQLI
jgi:glutathione S-transferase